MKKLIPLLLFMVACGSDSKPTSVAGNWKFSSIRCNDQQVLVSGYSETLALKDDGTGSVKVEASSCESTEQFTYLIQGDFIHSATTSIECSESPCDQVFSFNGSPFALNCPDDYPLANGERSFVVNGNTAQLSVSYSDDLECVSTYIKQ